MVTNLLNQHLFLCKLCVVRDGARIMSVGPVKETRCNQI